MLVFIQHYEIIDDTNSLKMREKTMICPRSEATYELLMNSKVIFFIFMFFLMLYNSYEVRQTEVL